MDLHCGNRNWNVLLSKTDEDALVEGQVLFLPAFAGNIIGATILAYAWDHLGIYNVLVKSGTKINLIDTIGPIGAILATLLMLGLLYALTVY